ncbi:MAG: heavy-metal-associated domain-containing protein [Bacteriovorax sp.]|nr:heavy-metal-associated domain-containing protein [Bacteriovorax sp.]
MKKIIIPLMLLTTINSFAGEKINVTVKGMVCSFCSQGITKKFKQQPSVKEVNVDLDTHLVSIELKDSQKLEDKLIETVLKDAGYGVEAISRK